MILLLGNKGGMGRRYSAIMRHLGIPFVGIDQGEPVPGTKYSGVIVATPTETHYDIVRLYRHLDIPILCEKPISRRIDHVRELVETTRYLTMVNQYEWLIDSDSEGDTVYNYWNSGKDGPQWDCINIIGLAKKPARISNKSPIWHCAINGHTLNIKDMDMAYCRMIDAWAKRPTSENRDYIIRAHSRVLQREYVYD